MTIKTTERTGAFLLFLIVTLYSIIFICLSLARFYGLASCILDLGVFDQIFWSMLHKAQPLSTPNEPYIQRHWLGFHFSPILYALLPVYALVPRPETLLVLNVLFIALGAVPIYMTSRYWKVSPALSLLWSTAFLVNPFVQSAVIWDFHEVALAIPIIGFALYAVASRNRTLLMAMIALLLLCKEQYGLDVIGIGLLWGIWHARWREGLLISIIGFLAFILVLAWIMPAYNTGYSIPVTNVQRRFLWLSYLKELDSSFIPGICLLGLIYIGKILCQFCLLPLKALIWLLPAGGDLLINTLDSTKFMVHPYAYHTAVIIPIFAIAAIQGGINWCKKNRAVHFSHISLIVLIINLGLGYLYSPVSIWEIHLHNLSNPYRSDIAQIKKMASDKPLSVQPNIGSFFSARSFLYYFPTKLEAVDTIILQLDSPYYESSSVFGSPFSIGAPDYATTVRALLNDPHWGITYWHNSWLVLERNKRSIIQDTSGIDQALDNIDARYTDIRQRLLSQ